MTITINPIQVTNAPGTFFTTLDGYIQGFAEDDPSARNWLTGGQLDPTETLPMWGGIPITEFVINPANLATALQATVKRATAAANVTGFSVFNQNPSAINSPASQVPLVSNNMQVMLYRLGTNARIAVAMDPALASSLPGAAITPTALNWDPTNGWITAASGGSGGWALPTTIRLTRYNVGNSMTVLYNSPSAGLANWNRAGSCALIQI